ncbi:hypothetical protein WUMEUNZI_CDS0029 [Salmonella phage SeKF_63]
MPDRVFSFIRKKYFVAEYGLLQNWRRVQESNLPIPC